MKRSGQLQVEGKLNLHRWRKVFNFSYFETFRSTATPATELLKFERDGFVSLCSPAAPYKEEGYWVKKSGFKIVDLGGSGKKVYVHPSVPEHDIHAGSVVAGGMPLRVLLLDF